MNQLDVHEYSFDISGFGSSDSSMPGTFFELVDEHVLYASGANQGDAALDAASVSAKKDSAMAGITNALSVATITPYSKHKAFYAKEQNRLENRLDSTYVKKMALGPDLGLLTDFNSLPQDEHGNDEFYKKNEGGCPNTMPPDLQENNGVGGLDFLNDDDEEETNQFDENGIPYFFRSTSTSGLSPITPEFNRKKRKRQTPLTPTTSPTTLNRKRTDRRSNVTHRKRVRFRLTKEKSVTKCSA